MTNLPFMGQLNTVFVVAIAFGMALNILVMIFHIINAVRARRYGKYLVFQQWNRGTCVLWIPGTDNCTLYDRAQDTGKYI